MKTLELSGFGGGYEATAQTMLTRGLKWASERTQVEDVKYEGYEGVYGLIKAKSPSAVALDHALLADHIDATGAMHQCVVENLLIILKHGYETWLKAAGEDRQMDIEDAEREEAVKKLLKFTNE